MTKNSLSNAPSALRRASGWISGLISGGIAVALLGVASAWSQIERLDLSQMVAKTDGCVVGKIVKSSVQRVDHPVDGEKLYFTTLTIEGRSLYTGRAVSVPVTFAGGFITPEDGVWNSEAPSANDTRIGAQVVAFYKWVDNMGGDVAANALYAAHGGLYRVVEARGATMVLGRGNGYAIDANTKLEALTESIAKLR